MDSLEKRAEADESRRRQRWHSVMKVVHQRGEIPASVLCVSLMGLDSH